MSATQPSRDSSKETLTSTGPKSLNADIALLSRLLNQPSALDDPDNTAAELDLNELFKSLDMADGIAGSVENRIDSLLGTLDDMLEGLESTAEDGDQAAAQNRDEDPVDDFAERQDAAKDSDVTSTAQEKTAKNDGG